ncbi:hypothetical protein [Arthrobacter sp. LjRoot14]|uniref:hypothetical protein n=1 Tax=Arthrobacter sp. LjRoot14 TaxID=3342265 RepID=UPI003F50AA2D
MSEVLNAEVTSSEEGGFSRRRVVKGVAWSVPVIVTAIAAPAAAASGGATVTVLGAGSAITFVGGGKGGNGPTGFRVDNAVGAISGSVTITPVGTVHAKIGIQQPASGEFQATTFNGYESTTLFTHAAGSQVVFPVTFTAAEDTTPTTKPKPNDVYNYVATVAVTVSGLTVQTQTNLSIRFK